MSGPLKGVSPAALDLARRFGLDPKKTFGPQDYPVGLDGYIRRDGRSALEANQAFEEDHNKVTGGNCGQDPSRLNKK